MSIAPEKELAYSVFDPQSTMEVEEEYGKKLLRMYPKELMQTDKVSDKKQKIKKVAKKKKR